GRSWGRGPGKSAVTGQREPWSRLLLQRTRRPGGVGGRRCGRQTAGYEQDLLVRDLSRERRERLRNLLGAAIRADGNDRSPAHGRDPRGAGPALDCDVTRAGAPRVAGNGDLRSELRHGGQTADRVAEDP